MYNEEQKNNYINFYTNVSDSRDIKNTRTSLTRLLQRLSVYEEKVQKDFGYMNREEINEVLYSFLTGSINTQSSMLSTLSNYFNWCLKNGLTFIKEDYLGTINIDTMNNYKYYKENGIFNEEELVEELDCALRPVQEDTIDNLYRLYCHLLFNGVTPQDALELKEDAVSLQDNTIDSNGKIITMSETLHQLFEYDIYIDNAKRWLYIKANPKNRILTRK